MKDRFPEIISKWFELSDLYFPVYDLYLSSINNPSIIIENEFRNLVEGLETYHRRRLPGKYLSNEEYKMHILPLFMESIPDDLENDFKMKLRHAFNYLNEYSLRKRIKDLIGNLPNELELKIQEEPNYKKDIIRNIVLIRNHFAHFNPDEKKYIPNDPNSLRLLNEEMRIILEANILQDLGFDPDYIHKFVRITKAYHH